MTQTMKNWTKTILGFLTVTLVLGTAAIYLLYPAKYLALDVNPSIELRVNRLNQVVAMVGANEDAAALLADYQPKTKQLDVVIDGMIDRMVEAGYLSADQKNEVLITSEQGADTQETIRLVSTQVQKSLARHAISAEILTQNISLDEATEKRASEHHVSAGKMAVIDRLMQQDASLTAEDLAQTRMSDLVQYAEQHQIPLELMESKLSDLQDALPKDAEALETLEDELEDAADAQEDKTEVEADAADDAKDIEEDKAEAAADAADDAKDIEEDKAEAAADDAKDIEEDKAEAAADATDDAKDIEEDKAEAAVEAAADAKDIEEDKTEVEADAADDAKDIEEDKVEAAEQDTDD